MLQEIWEQSGVRPDALVKKPELSDRWIIPYKVWVQVEGSRNYSPGGYAEIPFSEFYLWATAHDYTKAEMVCMWEDVHIIDKVWLAEQARRQEAKKATTSKSR